MNRRSFIKLAGSASITALISQNTAFASDVDTSEKARYVH